MKSPTPDRQTFDQLMLPHLDSAYRVALRLSGDPTLAEDLVQETYLRALAAFDQFELKSFGPKPWILKILHNVYITRRGKDARQPKLLDDVDFAGFANPGDRSGAGDMPVGEVDWEQFDQELKHSIEQLKPEYQVVLLLWAFEGLSYREIAEVCGVAVGTVMSRLFRARQQLGKTLAGYAADRNVPRGRER